MGAVHQLHIPLGLVSVGQVGSEKSEPCSGVGVSPAAAVSAERAGEDSLDSMVDVVELGGVQVAADWVADEHGLAAEEVVVAAGEAATF